MEVPDMREVVEWSKAMSQSAIASIDPKEIASIVDALTSAFRSGKRLYLMGNGGSSADAQHLAAEFTGRYLFDRPPLPAVSLSNIAPVTAIGNDYSFDEVFARQIDAYVQPGDVVIGISTSGNSPNVLRAIDKAKERGAVTISFSGAKGRLREVVDIALTIECPRTPNIQEAYMVAGHMICGMVEATLFGRKAVFIDRDDTIAKDVPYCSRPEDLHLFPGVPGAIARLNEAGFLVIMVTNQSGISRGYFDHEALDRIHAKMLQDVATGGGRIDDIFYCPHHPDEECDCRKPSTGMVLEAASKHHIHLPSSFVIGDSEKDIEMGMKCGCKSIQVSDEKTFVDAVEQILGSTN